MNEMRFFLGISEVYATSHQVAEIITHISDGKHVSFKNIIFGGYEMMETQLKIHAKWLSNALAPYQKKCLHQAFFCRPAGLQRLCEACALIAGMPIVCQIFARKAGAHQWRT